MNRSLVMQRLSIVDGTAGSIVGAATWCALHSQDAPTIVSALCERLIDASVPSRASLLFVLHEILLSCAAGATVDAGKRATINAVAALLPGTLKRALEMDTTDTTEVRAALAQVLGWWGGLRIFPTGWLEDVAQLMISGSPVHDAVEGQAAAHDDARDAELNTVAKCLAAYRAAKEHLRALTSEGADSQSIESAREDALTLLNSTIKALNEISTQLSVREMAELSHEPPASGSVPTATVPAPDIQDDVLGSFF
jgi:hypothetical protein